MHGAPEWVSGLHPVVAVALISIVPAFELSGSIPFGLLATELSPWAVIVTALIAELVRCADRVPVHALRAGPAAALGAFRGFWEWYTARIRDEAGAAARPLGRLGAVHLRRHPRARQRTVYRRRGCVPARVPLKQFVWVVLFGQLVAATL